MCVHLVNISFSHGKWEQTLLFLFYHSFDGVNLFFCNKVFLILIFSPSIYTQKYSFEVYVVGKRKNFFWEFFSPIHLVHWTYKCCLNCFRFLLLLLKWQHCFALCVWLTFCFTDFCYWGVFEMQNKWNKKKRNTWFDLILKCYTFIFFLHFIRLLLLYAGEKNAYWIP